MRLLAKMCVGVLLFFGIIILALVILANTINPNQYKSRIERVVYQQSGLRLELNGPLSWSFIPTLGIGFKQAEVEQPNGFPKKQAFVSIDSGKVGIGFWSLLTGHIAVKQLLFSGAKIHLIRLASGLSNWQALVENSVHQSPVSHSSSVTPVNPNTQLAQKTVPAKSIPVLANAPATKESWNLPSNWSVSKIKISDSALSWVDRQAKTAQHLTDFNVQGTDVQVGQPFLLSLGFQLTGVLPKPLQAKLSTEIQLAANKPEVSLDHLKLTANGMAVTGHLLVSQLQKQWKISGVLLGSDFASENWLGAGPTQFGFDSLASTFNLALNGPSVQGDLLLNLTKATLQSAKQKPIEVNSLKLTTDTLKIPGESSVQMAIHLNLPALNKPLAMQLSTELSLYPDSQQVALKHITYRDDWGNVLKGQMSQSSWQHLDLDAQVSSPSTLMLSGLAALRGAEVRVKQPVLRLDVQSENWPHLVDTLNGQYELSAGHSVLEGIDLDALLQASSNLFDSVKNGQFGGALGQVKLDMGKVVELKGHEVIANSGRQSQWQSINSQGTIKNGQVDDQSRIVADNYQLAGSGVVNLISQTLQYDLNLKTSRASGTTSAFVPLRISGRLNNPSVGINQAKLAQALKPIATAAIKTQVSDAIKDKAQSLLKGLWH